MHSSTLHAVTTALNAHRITKTYSGRRVLDGVDLVATPGRPLGLVGENGAGKSTLLRILAGTEEADSGSVTRPADVAYLPQDSEFRLDATVGSVLSDALAPLQAEVAQLESLAARMDQPDAAAQYAELLEVAMSHDAWDADRRAREAADRLGLGDLDDTRIVAEMSGGQRARLALAALIARRPSCVLLDEPTNHLDDDAITLLEAFLVSLPGFAVVASHDRTFLQRVCRQILDLDPAHFGTDGEGGNRYSGSYADYLAIKRDARRRWEEAFVAQQDELRTLRSAAATTARHVAHNRAPRDNDKFIHHVKGQNVARTISRRVRDAEKRIAVIEREEIPRPPKPLVFKGDLVPAGDSAPVVHVRGLVVPGRVAVPRLDLAGGEHLLITGSNGSGKSTLLKVLARSLHPTSGTVSVDARRVGFLPQDVVLPSHLTPQHVYDGLTGSPVPLIDLGLIHPRDVHRPIEALSLGQHRRLALAILVARRPDLLLLDEPTNHISLALADELEEALQSSPGTVVVASHDRWLRGRWDGEVHALQP